MKKSEFTMNIISPPKCMACNCSLPLDSGAMFCYECGKTYRKISTKTCGVCGRPIGEHADDLCAECKRTRKYYIKNVSRYLYKGCVKTAIRNMKFKRRIWICFEFGRAMCETIAEHYSDIKFDIIAYVPMTKFHEAKRGFNQSFEIASIISDKFKIPIVNDVLYKKINVKTQSGLSRKDRLTNIKDAFFVCNADKLTDKTVLLIDDIYTTGATLNECAKTLKKSGALAVYTATVAMTVLSE